MLVTRSCDGATRHIQYLDKAKIESFDALEVFNIQKSFF